MSRDYRGNLKWHSGLIVKKTGPPMYKVQVAPGITWRRHIDQLMSTAVGPDTVEVCKPEAVSLPSVPVQPSAPRDVVGIIPEMSVADRPEKDPAPAPTSCDPLEVT